MKRSKNMFLIIFSLIFCLLPIMSAISASPNQGKPVTLNAIDNDLRNILTGLAKANDVNLIMSNSVQGRISINLADVPFLDAIKLIAKSAGFTAEKYDNTVVVARPDEVKNFLPKITKTIKLQYISASSVKELVGGISLENLEILADQRTNVIIATGMETSLQKLEDLIKLLDVPVSGGEQTDLSTKVFTLNYAKASEIQTIVSSLASSSAKIIVDDRTNTLIINDKVPNLKQMEEIIAQLDIQTEKEKQEALSAQKTEPAPIPLLTQVFNLNHIEASALLPVIESLLSTNGKAQVFMKRKDIVVVEAVQSGSSGGGGSSSDSSGMKNFYKEKWSDALIVTDTPDIMEKVASIIEELDVKSLLIRIEAKIVEVDSDIGNDMGISWGATHSPSDSTIDSLFPAFIGRGIDVNVGTLSTDYFHDILVRLQAMENNGQAKLVSSPSVISLDNELAQMIVADRIPIMKTYETQFSSTTGFEFINIGVMLNVIPHITEDGYILMDTMPIVDSIKQWIGIDNSQPVVSSRVAHCRVRVKDGETIAIGGLMRDESYKSSEHIPWLGRLPLVGRLFGYTSTTDTKTDLMVFITPKIIKEDAQ